VGVTVDPGADRLRRVGVNVDFHLRPAVPHEFETSAFATNVARRAITDRVRVVRTLR
jgi:hypothetical protein